MSHVVTRFPDTILQEIESQATLEKLAAKELVKLLRAISISIPHEPHVALLIPASSPYKYGKIWVSSEHHYERLSDYYDEESEEPKKVFSDHKAHQQFFTQFSNEVEMRLWVLYSSKKSSL